MFGESDAGFFLGESDIGFFQSLFDFIIFIVLAFTLVLIGSMFVESKIGSVLRKWVEIILYPFYKLRSKLPHRFREGFDATLILAYYVGVILLFFYIGT